MSLTVSGSRQMKGRVADSGVEPHSLWSPGWNLTSCSSLGMTGNVKSIPGMCWIRCWGASFVASSVNCVKESPISCFSHLYLLCDRWAGWCHYWPFASATSTVYHWCYSSGTGPSQMCRVLKENHADQCRCNVWDQLTHEFHSLHRYRYIQIHADRKIN